MRQVGVIGLGVMGTAIVTRLSAEGWHVLAHDVRPAAAQALAHLPGVRVCSTAAAAADSGTVVLSLNDAAIVEDAVFGPAGAAGGMAGGGRVVDMSSIPPEATRRLAARAGAAGIAWVDAPLSGGAPKALAGDLTLMVGGDEAAVDTVRPVLDALASRVTHCGGPGAGQAVKVVNQVIVGLGMCALAESAALTRAWGLSPQTVVTALAGGRADSPLFQEFFGKFATADPAPTGRVSNMVKDLETARAAAVESGVPLPVTTAAAEVYRWLATRGLGGADPAALMAYLDPAVADATHWTETPA